MALPITHFYSCLYVHDLYIEYRLHDLGAPGFVKCYSFSVRLGFGYHFVLCRVAAFDVPSLWFRAFPLHFTFFLSFSLSFLLFLSFGLNALIPHVTYNFLFFLIPSRSCGARARSSNGLLKNRCTRDYTSTPSILSLAHSYIHTHTHQFQHECAHLPLHPSSAPASIVCAFRRFHFRYYYYYDSFFVLSPRYCCFFIVYAHSTCMHGVAMRWRSTDARRVLSSSPNIHYNITGGAGLFFFWLPLFGSHPMFPMSFSALRSVPPVWLRAECLNVPVPVRGCKAFTVILMIFMLMKIFN